MSLVEVTVQVQTDDDTPVPIEDVYYTLQDDGQTQVFEDGQTDASGEAGPFALTAGETYRLLLRKEKVTFTVPESFSVAGPAPETKTITGSPFTIGTPSDVSLCRVYGDVRRLDAFPWENCTVLVDNLYNNSVIDDLLILHPRLEAQTDTSGVWWIDLLRGSVVRFSFQYAKLIMRVQIPDQASVDLATLYQSAELEIDEVVRG
jgi:hypothetical protein